MELPEAAVEAAAGDEAAPGLADEGRADEARGLGRRETEQDLLDEILHQRHAARFVGARRRAAELGFGRGETSEGVERRPAGGKWVGSAKQLNPTSTARW